MKKIEVKELKDNMFETSALDAGSFCLHDVAGIALSVFPADCHSPEGSIASQEGDDHQWHYS